MPFLDLPNDDPKRAARRPLLLSILIALGVGALGSVATEPNIRTWYAGLLHPSFAPPNWLFAPVWTALYIVMGWAAFRVWRVTGLKSPAIQLYAFQLALNLAWSFLFFGLHRIGAALLEIALLWLAILATAILFGRADRLAGLLSAAVFGLDQLRRGLELCLLVLELLSSSLPLAQAHGVRRCRRSTGPAPTLRAPRMLTDAGFAAALNYAFWQLNG